MTPSPALILLEREADRKYVTTSLLVGSSDTRLDALTLPGCVRTPTLLAGVATEQLDGRGPTYVIEITDPSWVPARPFAPGAVRVREFPGARKLPGVCFPRHIVREGYFCLGFDPSQPSYPITRNDAQKFWGILHHFLKLQNKATLSGKWQDDAWPHGRKAAEIQIELDRVLETVPASLQEWNTTTTPGKQCPCGSALRVEACHGPNLIQIRKLRDEVRKAEQQFYQANSGLACCGTMRACGLAPS